MSARATCPFCERVSSGAAGGLAVAIDDGFPVAQGHTLVVPRRHCADMFELTAAEFEAVWSVVREVRNELHARLRPDGLTIGVNAGAAAGQTVAHAHVHVIPRFHGDVPDPHGGVRWVIPQRAAYWEVPQR